MLLLASFLFFLTVISYVRFFRSMRCSKKLNLNELSYSDILEYLGYYNLNVNAAKIFFIVESMNYLLFSTNPNYNQLYTCDITNRQQMYSDFENYCTEQHKHKFDMTANEIINFIKNHEIFKELNNKISYYTSRTITLSKYANDPTNDNLINALTDDEYQRLISSVKCV